MTSAAERRQRHANVRPSSRRSHGWPTIAAVRGRPHGGERLGAQAFGSSPSIDVAAVADVDYSQDAGLVVDLVQDPVGSAAGRPHARQSPWQWLADAAWGLEEVAGEKLHYCRRQRLWEAVGEGAGGRSGDEQSMGRRLVHPL
jgi:hypothetical protein